MQSAGCIGVRICVPAVVSADRMANGERGKVVAQNVASIDCCLILYVATSTNLSTESESEIMDASSSRTPRAFGWEMRHSYYQPHIHIHRG
jgi:hypothetical protein